VRSSNTPELETRRLMLAPLQVADAREMVDVLADPELYGFTGGEPPNLGDLQARYRSQFAGPAADDEVWHNWILRLKASGRPIGFVQASVTGTLLTWHGWWAPTGNAAASPARPP